MGMGMSDFCAPICLSGPAVHFLSLSLFSLNSCQRLCKGEKEEVIIFVFFSLCLSSLLLGNADALGGVWATHLSPGIARHLMSDWAGAVLALVEFEVGLGAGAVVNRANGLKTVVHALAVASDLLGLTLEV